MTTKVKGSIWSWESRFGRNLVLCWAAFALLVICHVWQESQGEDGATVWSCHTMGNRQCGPDQPWHGISVRWNRP